MSFTTSTGAVHVSTTCFAVLPSSHVMIPPCPLCPITMRSASFDASLMTCVALPSITSAVACRSGYCCASLCSCSVCICSRFLWSFSWYSGM